MKAIVFQITTLLILSSSLFLTPCNGQNTISDGTHFTVSHGTFVNSPESLEITSGGSLTVNGTLVLKKNLVNNNASSYLGSGTIEFSGTTAQGITGQNTIGKLVVNNAAGLDILGHTYVDSSLSLVNGAIRTGVKNLNLGPAATIGGTPSVNAMVVATSTGELRKTFASAGSFTFPVGDKTATSDYSPVSITFTSGTFAPGSYVGVKLTDAAYAGATDNYLTRYWQLSQNGISDPLFDASFQYVAADVVGDESLINTLRVDPSPITSYGQANTLLHQLNATSLNSFGTYTGGPGLVDKILNLNILLEGLYAGYGYMNKASNSTGYQFGGSIADQVSVELHQASYYPTIAYTKPNVDLLTNGSASVSIPSSYSGAYYITLKHRNSEAITSSSPVSFATSSISYSYNAPSMVYGGNLKLMPDGHYVVFGGDANQDGIVNIYDIDAITSSASTFNQGYAATDINGDGIADALDLILTDNNAVNSVMAIFP